MEAHAGFESGGICSRQHFAIGRGYSMAALGTAEGVMRTLIGLMLAFALAGCSVCKSSDSPEVCRTKQRDHNQPRTEFSVPLVSLNR